VAWTIIEWLNLVSITLQKHGLHTSCRVEHEQRNTFSWFTIKHLELPFCNLSASGNYLTHGEAYPTVLMVREINICSAFQECFNLRTPDKTVNSVIFLNLQTFFINSKQQVAIFFHRVCYNKLIPRSMCTWCWKLCQKQHNFSW